MPYLAVVLIFLALITAGSPASAPLASPDALTVDTTVIRGVPAALGVNLNYLMDGQLTAPQLGTLGAQVLRYPGGEKSDTNLWSVPPFGAPRPSIARLGPNQFPGGNRALINPDGSFVTPPLDFDQFLALAEATGATPLVVVPFDSAFAPAEPGGTAPSYAQLKATVVAWVKYAAGRVVYWEIGNESYIGGYNGSPSAAQYAAGVKDFAQAMKAVDPAIKIGANGGSSSWWSTVISTAGNSIDFLSVHNYPLWNIGSYSSYRNSTASLVSDIDRARSAIGSRPLFIALTESGALTASAWSPTADLGHAVALADILMAQTYAKNIRFNLAWNTRWITTAQGPRAYDALTSGGSLTPAGQLQAFLARSIGSQVVTTSGNSKVHLLATADAAGLRIIVLNKDTSSRSVAITLKGGSASGSAVVREQFGGGSPGDLAPTVRARSNATLSGGKITITLDPVSVTALTIGGAYGKR